MSEQDDKSADAVSDVASDESTEHFRKATQQRDKYKAQNKDLALANRELETQLKKMNKQQQIAENDKDAMLVSADAELKDLGEKLLSANNTIQSFQEGQLREAVSGNILTTVNGANKDKARLLLDGLQARGQINLLPDEDSQDQEIEKARTMLQEIDPSLFAVDAGRAPGTPGLPGSAPSGGKKKVSNGVNTQNTSISARLAAMQKQ